MGWRSRKRKLEARILEEVANRVQERSGTLEEERRRALTEKAEIQALVEVSGLPKREVKRIAKEVRREFISRRGRLARFALAGTVLLVIGGLILSSIAFGVPSRSPLAWPGSLFSAFLRDEEDPESRAFIRAVEEGDLDYAEAWLDRGVSVDASGPGGITALMTAAAAGQVEAIRFLLRRGADIRRRDREGFTAIDYALLNNQTPAKNILGRHLSQGTEPGSVERRLWAENIPFSGVSFVRSAGQGNAEAVGLFLDAGFDVGFRDSGGETALEKAVRGGHIPTVRALLRKRHPSSLRRRLIDECRTSGRMELALVLEEGS